MSKSEMVLAATLLCLSATVAFSETGGYAWSYDWSNADGRGYRRF